MLEQKFIGKLNSDDSDRDLEEAVKDCLNLVPIKNGIGQSLRVENSKGNQLVPNSLIPSGENKTIGQFSDKNNQRIVYFNYNSEDNHSIFVYEKTENRVYKILETSELSFLSDDIITGAGLINDQLVFTDTRNEVRSVDVQIGKNTFDSSEVRKWEVLIDDFGGEFTFTVTDSNGVEYARVGLSENIDDIVSSFNTSPYLTATKCNNKSVEIEETTLGTVKSISVTNNFGVAPLNTYPLPITQRQITLIKYPLGCPPELEFDTDTTRSINLIQDIPFQFAIRYIYFDDSMSTISSYSKLLAKKGCGGESDEVKNIIKVVFKDSNYSQEELMLIKNVEVLFREGNTGSFYKAATLNRDEFFQGFYNFYNDGSYDVLPDTDVSKLFDSIPNKANALAILKNRLFLGGITEGYDTPCVDADLSVDVDEDKNANTWTITGRVRIVNRFLQPQDDGSIAHYNQPIHSPADSTDRNTWVYGGLGGRVTAFGASISNGGFITENEHSQYQQFIPEGGFTVFLAGTNYWAISKQVTKSYDDPVEKDADTVTDTPIIFATKENKDVFDLVVPANEEGRATVRRVMEQSNLYSTFEITGVPPGKYIVRVASPLCARNEYLRSDTDSMYSLDGAISKWQSTSAFVVSMNGNPNSYKGNVRAFYPQNEQEIVIELGDEGGTYDLHQGSSSNAVLIADLTDLSDTTNSIINKGYLVDSETDDSEGFQTSLRMERQNIGVTTSALQLAGNTSEYQLKTDHNGAFWFGFEGTFFNAKLIRFLIYTGGQVNTAEFPYLGINFNSEYEIKNWRQDHYRDADISNVVNGDVTTFPKKTDFSNNKFTTKLIAYNYNSRVRDFYRTTISGQVVDSDGVGIGGLLASITKTGRNEVTDSRGFFNIVTYADANVTSASDRDLKRTEDIIIGKGNNACVSMTDIKQTFTATPIGSDDYNNETPYLLADIVITDLVDRTAAVHKANGVYKWGLVYYDEAMRSSFTATQDKLRKRMPFPTEDLGVTLPDKYPLGTFINGTPRISWSINSKPPEWAHYYQWVRTKDTAHSTYLTWVANDIIYASNWNDADPEASFPEDVGYSSSLANEIYIDISNIDTYLKEKTDAKIGYTFAEGDRLILIKNDGVTFEEYVDLPIRGQKGDWVIIESLGTLEELLPGLKFQIYTPKLQNETEIYYEIGECYNVLNPREASRSHEVSNGTFRRGDVYVLGRTITTDTGAINDTFEHPTIADKELRRFSDIGRPNTVNVNAKTEYFYSTIRFSNPFIQNAYDNGLSSFNSLDKEDLPLDRGEITKMIATTNVVVTLQKTEATSVYIGEGFLHTADGGAVEIKTDKIIGDERSLKGEYGTINPESVVEYDDVVYWYDQNKGEIIRYSNNGLTPLGLVSKYRTELLKIHNFIKENGYTSKVYGGYNPILDMAIMTFKDINGGFVTIAFQERSDSFRTRFSFNPEHYSYIDTKMYSFLSGQLYEHDVDSVGRNTFYGETYPSSVHLVSNIEDTMEKIYRSIGIKSNKKWAATSIYNKEGQETSLVVDDFVQRDEMYYADILRNQNTNTDTLLPNQSPLLHGEEMRSQIMDIIIENTSTEEVELDFVVIDTQVSPGHLINN